VRIDPVVHHGDLIAKQRREGAGLPVRRAEAGISHLEVQQVVEVFEPQAADVARILGWKLGVEAHVRAVRVVEELAVDAELGVGPDILQEQALAPAVMGDDDVGREALSLHLQGRPKAGLAADGLGFEVRDPRMHVPGGAATGGVGHEFHALPLLHLGLLHGHRHDAVAVLDQGRREELELAGEVLVDEEDVHAHTFSTPSFTYPCRVGGKPVSITLELAE
jgi:hypothetical protein